MGAQQNDLGEVQECPEHRDVVATVYERGAERGHCACLAGWDDLKVLW